MSSKILVIDDDADTRSLIEVMLKSFGCEVILAESGEKGLENLKTKEQADRFDAVFLDLMMPGISGFGVIEAMKLKEHTKKLPVIMLTAKDSANDMITGYKFGADYYIPKPFTKDQIQFGLDIVFDSTTETDELEELS
ncbi:MAG: response regulator [Bdellovibrionota bacterium]